MLDTEDLNLRRLIEWLMTPAKCGVYLSSDDLTRIGECLGLRIMAMSRKSALEQLFQSAALDGVVDGLFGSLIKELHQHRTAYISLDTLALEGRIAQVDVAVITLRDLQSTWRVHDQNIGEP